MNLVSDEAAFHISHCKSLQATYHKTGTEERSLNYREASGLPYNIKHTSSVPSYLLPTLPTPSVDLQNSKPEKEFEAS